MPTCQCVLRANVLTFRRVLRGAHVATCLACLRAHVPMCLVCLLAHVAIFGNSVILENISSCDNKDKITSKKNDNTTIPVVESSMKKLEYQLIDVRIKYKERYDENNFVKIKDKSIDNPSNVLDDLIEINSENNNDVNTKDSLKDSETKNSSIDKAMIYKNIKKKSV